MAKSKRRTILKLFLLLNYLLQGALSENILFLLPLSTTSHRIFFEPLINALAEKGHDITVLTNKKSSDVVPKVKELIAIPNEDYIKGYIDPFENLKDKNRRMSFPFQFILEGCHKVIQSSEFRGIMRQNKFDLIIVDSFLSGCLSGFIYKLKTPFISVTTLPAPSYISERFGNFYPASIIPVLSFKGYEGPRAEMGFTSRLLNFVHFVLARFYVNFAVLPSLEKVYREYLGDEIPGIMEIESQASMLFMNSHYSMNFPRPLLPTVVEVGGMHCRNAIELNNTKLEEFISKAAAPYGFIYFNMGTIIDLNNAPDEFINSLMKAFAKLKQRVILKWKRKGVNSTRHTFIIPKNVWIGDWFSQQDVLGHENIRLFISHGGLLSMQESVYHSVPVIGIPFGIDQDTNVHSAVLQGFALKIDLNNVNEFTLSSSINEMLDNSSYSENVKKIGKTFRKRLVSPLETAMYWTEHVMEAHKGNNQLLHSPARNLSYLQYYSYDVVLVLTISTSIVLIVLILFIRKLTIEILKFISKPDCTIHDKRDKKVN